MKKLIIAIALTTALGQFLGKVVTKSDPGIQQTANVESCKRLPCLPFFSYI